MPSEDQKITPIGKPEEAADANGEFARLLAESERSLAEGELIRGRVIQVTNDEILVDIGYKSEGMIPRSEFAHSPDRLPVAGQEIDAIVERREDASGYVVLSHEKARRIRAWDAIEAAFKENLPGEGQGPRARQGRPLGRHRGPGVPPGLARRHPAAQEPRRPPRARARVPDRQLRQEARQHRPLAQGAHRGGRRGEEAGGRRGARRRPDAPRRGQEPHRVRRVRRPRRDRRPPPRHRHLVGPPRPPVRGPPRRPGGRGQGPEVRPRVRAVSRSA